MEVYFTKITDNNSVIKYSLYLLRNLLRNNESLR